MAKEKSFIGRNYADEKHATSAKAREIAKEKSKPTQATALGDTTEIARACWETYKKSPIQDAKTAVWKKGESIRLGGKFKWDDLVIIASPEINFIENGGKDNYNCVLYFPQTGAVRLIGSITSWRNRIKSQLKDLK